MAEGHKQNDAVSADVTEENPDDRSGWRPGLNQISDTALLLL